MNELGVHLSWLLDAIRPGAKRRDGFEVERHFAVSSGDAVRLGEVLHGVAGSAAALAAIDCVVVEYRSSGGGLARLMFACDGDGRLGAPAFN